MAARSSDDAVLRVMVKEFLPSDQLASVVSDYIPHLQHGNDGLVFTASDGRYITGTSNKM